MPDDYIGLLPWFADPYALVPCMFQIGVTTASARSEPRTPATATIHFARLANVDTFETYRSNDRRRDCWCLHVGIGRKDTKKKTSLSADIQIVLNLHLQASTPSNHLWSAFLLPAPPHFLNQAPPGARQLALPDFSNVPHFGHASILAIVKARAGVLTDVVIDVLDMSSRSGNGRRDKCYFGMWGDGHLFRDIDPWEPSNIEVLVAFDCTQSTPQSFCSNAAASLNIVSISVTLETSHFEMSPLKDVALTNIPYIPSHLRHPSLRYPH